MGSRGGWQQSSISAVDTRRGLLLVIVLIACFLPGVTSGAVPRGKPAAGSFYFTTYGAQPSPGSTGEFNVWRVTYSFNGARFTLRRPTGIALLRTGADGIASAPDGSLLVANGTVSRVNPKTRAVSSQPASSGTPCTTGEHIVVAPNGSKAYTSAQPGPLAVVPLRPLGPLICRPLQGGDDQVTGLAFDSHGNAFYTASGAAGGGRFGRIDLKHFVTTRKYASLPAAHGILFDSYTGDLVLVGSSHVTQIDPRSLRVVSDRDMSKDRCGQQTCGLVFDQGATDGAGHLFIASNDGHLAFLDISLTRRVASGRTFVALPFLMPTLDDTDSHVASGRAPSAVRRPTKKTAPARPRFTG